MPKLNRLHIAANATQDPAKFTNRVQWRRAAGEGGGTSILLPGEAEQPPS
jgi:hypothetical protein